MADTLISLREAAERLGITTKAIKYRLRVRSITPVLIDGRFGPTLAIDELQYQAICRPVSALREEVAGREVTPLFSRVVSRETTLEKVVTQEVSLEKEPTLASALELAAKTMDALAAERAEREQAQLHRERAERRADALAAELGAYRRALSESAESLAQERALRLTIEAKELESLKLSTPIQESSGWGQRVRHWFRVGLKVS
jgi:hypothetical protein